MTDSNKRKVVTRFAPSPTGFLHIGGARTALFNWLYAKHHGGTMMLRIEDTDRARSTQAAVDAILDGLAWLGLDWDGKPVFQASRVHRHQQVAAQMLSDGTAYRCSCSKDKLDALRAQSKANGRPFRHRCSCRDNTTQRQGDRDDDGDHVIRLKVPDDGDKTTTTVVNDLVKGNFTTHNRDLDDLVLVRTDGSPTYMLAVVVDDHDMGVTHIIRGDDHATNAARQTLIYQALGWQVPSMAHIPLIHGSDGSKLSKRHGALGADAYRGMGYLPQAMLNYLARLGWSHGDDEIMSLDYLIRCFDLDAVGKSPARFDLRKLDSLNGHYIRNMDDDDQLLHHWKVCLRHSGRDHANDVLGWLNIPANNDRLRRALPALKHRAKTLHDLTDGASYLWRQRPLDMDAKAAKILGKDGASTILSDLYSYVLADDCALSWNNANDLQNCIQSYATDKGLKLALVAQPLRAALTGRGVSIGIYDLLISLGRADSLDRIHYQANKLKPVVGSSNN